MTGKHWQKSLKTLAMTQKIVMNSKEIVPLSVKS